MRAFKIILSHCLLPDRNFDMNHCPQNDLPPEFWRGRFGTNLIEPTNAGESIAHRFARRAAGSGASGDGSHIRLGRCVDFPGWEIARLPPSAKRSGGRHFRILSRFARSPRCGKPACRHSPPGIRCLIRSSYPST